MTTETKPDHIKALAETVNKPSLHALSYAMRHPETWPEGFVWDFSEWSGCAMALARRLWLSDVPEPQEDENNECWRAWVSMIARTFAIPFSDCARMFYSNDWTVRPKVRFGFTVGASPATEWENITPEMVADEIDRYLRDHQ